LPYPIDKKAESEDRENRDEAKVVKHVVSASYFNREQPPWSCGKRSGDVSIRKGALHPN
jgi:hypothetical protein